MQFVDVTSPVWQEIAGQERHWSQSPAASALQPCPANHTSLVCYFKQIHLLGICSKCKCIYITYSLRTRCCKGSWQFSLNTFFISNICLCTFIIHSFIVLHSIYNTVKIWLTLQKFLFTVNWMRTHTGTRIHSMCMPTHTSTHLKHKQIINMDLRQTTVKWIQLHPISPWK